MTYRSPLVFMTLCFFLLFTGCKKKGVMEVDNETQSAVDHAIADQEFISMIPAFYHSAMVTAGLIDDTLRNTCDTMTFIGGDRYGYTAAPVYELGTSCSSVFPDGKSRSGLIIAEVSQRLNQPGARVAIRTRDYRAGGVSYACDSLVLTVKETDHPRRVVLRARLINGQCTPAGRLISFSFDRTVYLYPEGEGSRDQSHMYIYGESAGTNRQGNSFTASVSPATSLVKQRNCPFIDQGIMELTPRGFKPRVVDFGAGNCDDGATFTVNENTVAFKLK